MDREVAASAAPISNKKDRGDKNRNLRYDSGFIGAVRQVVVLVSVNETREDNCLHCHSTLDIVLVRFKLTGTVMMRACSNCALACAEDSAQRRPLDLFLAYLKRRADHQ
jgi:hypothetical protein